MFSAVWFWKDFSANRNLCEILQRAASLIFQDNFFLPLDGAGRRNKKLLSTEF